LKEFVKKSQYDYHINHKYQYKESAAFCSKMLQNKKVKKQNDNKIEKLMDHLIKLEANKNVNEKMMRLEV
jgi:hypothetical protein